MAIANGYQTVVATPLISTNITSIHNSIFHKGCKTVTGGVRKNSKTNSPNAFVPLIFYGNSYKYFAFSPTASFAKFFPPMKVSSTSTVPDNLSRPGRTMARRILCNHVQAVR